MTNKLVPYKEVVGVQSNKISVRRSVYSSNREGKKGVKR